MVVTEVSSPPRPRSPAAARLLEGARHDGTLIEPLVGVLCPPDLVASIEGRAAVIRAGVPTHVIVRGVTARWLWTGGAPPRLADLAVTRQWRTGIRKHLAVVPSSYDVDTSWRGLVVASPRQLVVDAACAADEAAVHGLLGALAPTGLRPADALAHASAQRQLTGVPAARRLLARLVAE
ncbi:hypothetical protein H8R18_04210 [Nanchangia anserum]|uniref:AbiEi antitoxin C-terminal domain-containing protein n=1 Tax=Nanchangia anserum TaxID=2692125 RepID=A0A8I0KPD0_9ACTO|nr:hypothetical protein [Nanchangia anserum]MBD3688760.1 hypothetical protein [Nanchangia anserum]QOX82501.1 hypothetical protein H8R18_04210 [Nanchangia anserum]